MNENFCVPKQEVTVIPSGLMSRDDVYSLKYTLSEYTDNLPIDYIGMEEFVSKVGLEFVNDNGRVIRRILNFLWKSRGIRLPQDVLDKLSRTYKTIHIDPQQETFVVDVVNTFHWRDGMFGHSGSCWWDQYPQSRQTFERQGGLCLRKFTDMNDKIGVGRVWLYPYKSGFLMFNLYGWTYGQVRSVIGSLYGIDYPLKPIVLCNDADYSTPYINCDTCSMLPTDEYEDEVNVYWPKVRGEYADYQCDVCQKAYMYGSQVNILSDNTCVCNTCGGYNGKCKSCGDKTKDSDLCDYCLKYANDDFNFQEVEPETYHENIPDWIMRNGTILKRYENGGDMLLNQTVYTLEFDYDSQQYKITNMVTEFAYFNPQAECLFKQPR